ncbi:cell division protein FtsQ/DivIB [Candidatus Soleaferrea massiliensis]|uniref:cell division protein FtsQ/DivIB n=1 Tax=Candidatus Soleaferrea massiliensis TaxID=1470354 RepID=UPI000590AAE1|nr:FtsQ-type POTRA domain-containing protein [Candidatus Soleaferrea massiliensis]
MKKKAVQQTSRAKARTQNSRRHARRRKRRIILVNTLLILFVLVGAVVLIMTMFFKISDLVVEGSSEQYTSEQVLEKSGLVTGINIFDFDLEGAEQKVGSALPYLDEVEIERRLPNKVVIRIKDTVPAANVKTGGDYILIDAKGKVLMTGQQKPKEGLPLVTGLNVGQVVVGDYLNDKNATNFPIYKALIGAVESHNIQDIGVIDLNDDFNLKMLYQDRIVICLGTDSELDYKCRFVKKMLDEKVAEKEVGVMDASVSGRVSIRDREIDGLIDTGSQNATANSEKE